MGIAHVSLAPDDAGPRLLTRFGMETLGPTLRGTTRPPRVNLTLAQWSGRGVAKESAGPR